MKKEVRSPTTGDVVEPEHAVHSPTSGNKVDEQHQENQQKPPHEQDDINKLRADLARIQGENNNMKQELERLRNQTRSFGMPVDQIKSENEKNELRLDRNTPSGDLRPFYKEMKKE